jgi:hypothetical protein
MFNKFEGVIPLSELQGTKGQSHLPLVLTIIGGLLGLLASYSVAETGSVPVIVPPLILAAGAALLILAWKNWEAGIKAILVVLIVEGAVRKWFLPEASQLVYFYKDLLMIVIVISYLTRKHKSASLIRHELKMFSIPIAAFSIYVLAAISNPALPHPLVGLLGLKAYLLYVPLAFLVPQMFTTKEKLVAFLKWYLIIALPVVVLSVMQFADSEPNSALNRYAWDEQTVAASGMDMEVANFLDSGGSSYIRVSGPFSYISGLAVYLPTMFALMLGLSSQYLKRIFRNGLRWIYYVALAAVATTAFMTGSRGAVVNLGLITLIFYGMSSRKDLLRLSRQAIVGAVLIFIGLTIVFPQALNALYTRAFGGETQFEESRGRIAEVYNLPFNEAGYAGAFGYGVGATQNATPVMMSKLDLPFIGERIPIGYEGESGRVMLELGIVGYLLHLFVRLSVLVMLLYACFSIRDAEAKSLAVAAFAAVLFPIIIGGAVVQHTQSVYQWFLIGIPLAMLNAERRSARLAAESRSVLADAVNGRRFTASAAG